MFLDNKNTYEFAERQSIECKFLADASPQNIRGIIKKINPDIIFTDTNDTDFSVSIDKQFLKAGRKFNKSTISIVDSWIDYRGRFGAQLEYLPGSILAIDQKMKHDLIAMGISKDIIEITGSPRFNKFSTIKKAREKKNMVVFYSQPISGRKINEVEIFRDIVSVMEKTHPKKDIIIKFHPTREASTKHREKYDAIIKHSTLKIKKAKKNTNAEDISKKAELVMGINSIALVDAALMGKKVVSYQPGIDKKDDSLMSNARGWSLPVYQKEKLASVLRDVFKKPVILKHEIEKYTKNGSTGKVINCITNMLP
ncbi:MAG: hypothetical protein Q7S10_01370 [bacterium]|nr:hypothetical protein [bacterium]